MDPNQIVPSLFFIITFPHKIRKQLILSHKVEGSQKDLKFKIGYVFEKTEKLGKEEYSIIIASYYNNLDRIYNASITAAFDDIIYSSNRIELENGKPKFEYNLSFKDSKGNKLKSLNVESKYKIFNEYITRQSPEIQEKLHDDTIKVVTNVIDKGNKIEPKLFYSVFSNCKKEEYQNKLIQKFDFSILKNFTEAINSIDESVMQKISENNRNSEKPSLNIEKFNAYYYFCNDKNKFTDYLITSPFGEQIADSILDNKGCFPDVKNINLNTISLSVTKDGIENLFLKYNTVDEMLNEIEKHFSHIKKIVQKHNSSLNLKFDRAQIANGEHDFIRKYKNLWRLEKKNNIVLSNINLNVLIEAYSNENENDLQKLKELKTYILENFDKNEEQIDIINEKLHKNFLSLIKKNTFTNNQILDIMEKEDEYYYNGKYDSSKKPIDIIDYIDITKIDEEFKNKFTKMNFKIIFKENIDFFIKKLFEKCKGFSHLNQLIYLINTNNELEITNVILKEMVDTFVVIFQNTSEEKTEMEQCFKYIIEFGNNNHNMEALFDGIEKANKPNEIMFLYNERIQLLEKNNDFKNVVERMNKFVKSQVEISLSEYIDKFSSIKTLIEKNTIFDKLNKEFIIKKNDFYTNNLSQSLIYMDKLNKYNIFTSNIEKEKEYVKKTKEVINEIEREFINGDYEIEKIPLIKAQKESGMLRKKLIIINYGDEKIAEEKENQGLNKIKETEDVKAQVEKVKDFYEIFFKEFEIYRELMRIIGNPKLKLKEFCLFSKNYPNIIDDFKHNDTLKALLNSKIFNFYFSSLKKKSKSISEVIENTKNKLDEYKSIFTSEDVKHPNLSKEQEKIITQFTNLEEMHQDFAIIKKFLKMEEVNTEQIENSIHYKYIEKLVDEEKTIEITKDNVTKEESLFDTNLEKLTLNVSISTENNSEYDGSISLKDENSNQLIREIKKFKGEDNKLFNLTKDTPFSYKFESNQQIQISINKYRNGLLIEKKTIETPISSLMVKKNSSEKLFNKEDININCQEDELFKDKLVTLNLQVPFGNEKKDEKLFYTIDNKNQTIFKSQLCDIGSIKPVVLPEKLLLPSFSMDYYSLFTETPTNNGNNQVTTKSTVKKIGNVETNVEEVTKKKDIELKTNDGTKIPMTIKTTTVKYTFIKFIKEMGGRFNVTFGIDFTGSNYNAKKNIDQHCIKPINKDKTNYYKKAILECGEVLDKYSKDHYYSVFGFGLKFEGQLTQCKNINASNQKIHSLQKVVEEYDEFLNKIILSSPSSICPIIDKFKEEIQKSSNPKSFNVLMIITDGCISDYKEVIDSVIEGQNLPMCINIIGIGAQPPKQMKRLNGDFGSIKDSKGNRLERKVLNYFHLNDYTQKNNINKNFKMLKGDLMKTIPHNVTEYLNKYK